jgi:hypothetical protein
MRVQRHDAVRAIEGEGRKKERRRTHEIEVYAMIDQVILPRLHCRRRAKVHAVLLARLLDVLVRACQAQDGWVELGEVLLQHFGRVARRVAGDHEGDHDIAALLLDFVVHKRHLVELVGADVGAVREAKVDLAGVSIPQLYGMDDLPASISPADPRA